jgi:hypothetical protein
MGFAKLPATSHGNRKEYASQAGSNAFRNIHQMPRWMPNRFARRFIGHQPALLLGECRSYYACSRGRWDVQFEYAGSKYESLE